MARYIAGPGVPRGFDERRVVTRLTRGNVMLTGENAKRRSGTLAASPTCGTAPAAAIMTAYGPTLVEYVPQRSTENFSFENRVSDQTLLIYVQYDGFLPISCSGGRCFII